MHKKAESPKDNWEEWLHESDTYYNGNERIDVIRLDMNYFSLSLYMKSNFKLKAFNINMKKLHKVDNK